MIYKIVSGVTGVCCDTFSSVWKVRMTVQIGTLLKRKNVVLSTNLINAEVSGERASVVQKTKKTPLEI